MSGTTIENLVIGGGPAGAMAALRLAQAGHAVTLVEKERGPHHKVCGEFLSQEAMQYLEPTGINLKGLGAVAIDRVRLHTHGRLVEQALPFRAMSLSRLVLDEALLARARKAGCEVRRGVEVTEMMRDGEGWRIAVRGADAMRARTVFLATGKHEVRGWSRRRGTQADLVGFKMHWQLRAAQIEALREAMELFLIPGGYGGISLVEGDAATLCFVIRRSRLQKLGGWAGAIGEIKHACESLRERLEAADALYEKPLAISPIPYGYMVGEERGVWCVGDQAAVIPSFTGDGMSIALHSGAMAAEMALAGKSITEFNATMRAQLKSGMRLATVLSQAIVTVPGRLLAPSLSQLAPGGLRWIAGATRIPERALIAGRQQVSPA